MTERCPHCGKEVSGACQECPVCRWDFVNHQKTNSLESASYSREVRIVPEASAKPPSPGLSPAAKKGSLTGFQIPPAKGLPPSLTLGTSPGTDLKRSKGYTDEFELSPMARHSRAIIVSVENPTPKGFFSRLPALSLAQGLVAAAFIIASAFLGAVHLTLKSDAGPAQWLAIHDVASTQWKNPTTLPAEHASIVHFPVREDARDAAAALPAKAAPWRFEGWAYDLLTLRPVPNALLVFRDRQNRVCAQTVSDGDGQFKASFDPLEGGCVLRVHHPSYQEGYLDEMNPRFREVGLNERLGLIKRTAAPLPWLSSGKIPIRRDVFLLPLPPSSSAESPRKQTPRP